MTKDIVLCGRKYSINDAGEVFRNGKKLRQYVDVYGYVYILLKENEKRKKYRVHRLVASAFIPNECGKPQINHKDGIKSNNHVSNLEWATNGENQTHSRYILNNTTGFADTPVKCVETGIEYKSTREAWRATGINYCHISEAANGKRKSAGNYRWEKIE